MDTLQGLFEIIEYRKQNHAEGSYTCYLFDKGLDKILKKVGEESAETIIAAKNGDKDEIINESCDLIYHLLVMLSQRDIPFSDVIAQLEIRRQKQGNLKEMKTVDKNT